MKKYFSLRNLVFVSGAIVTAVTTFGAGLPAWAGIAATFLAGTAVNAEKVFSRKAPPTH